MANSGFNKSTTLPPPKTGQAGAAKTIFWAFIAIVLLGLLTFWLVSEPADRAAMRTRAAEIINNALKETPLAGVGDILTDTPPPPPPEVLNPPTDSGTLAGRTITGTIGSPIDTGPARRIPLRELTSPSLPDEPETGPNTPGAPEEQTDILSGTAAPPVPMPGSPTTTANPQAPLSTPRFSPQPLPPATEDSRVPPSYLSEVANWLAASYRPGPQGGTLAFGVRGANHLLGVTIAGKSSGGRSSLLRYAFQPSMLVGLYKLYINRFMEDLDAAAVQRGLDEEQNRGFHRALAGRSAMVAAVLDGALQVPNLGSRLARIDELAQTGVEINAQLANAVFELDELRAANASPSQISTTQMRVDGITHRYRRAVDEHARALAALAAEIRKNSGQNMDEDSLLYLASWVERRLSDDSEASESIKNCAILLRDLARRCAEAGAVN